METLSSRVIWHQKNSTMKKDRGSGKGVKVSGENWKVFGRHVDRRILISGRTKLANSECHKKGRVESRTKKREEDREQFGGEQSQNVNKK